VTVSRLLEISPVGTADPTPFLYDNLLVTMASLQVRLTKPIAFIPQKRGYVPRQDSIWLIVYHCVDYVWSPALYKLQRHIFSFWWYVLYFMN